MGLQKSRGKCLLCTLREFPTQLRYAISVGKYHLCLAVYFETLACKPSQFSCTVHLKLELASRFDRMEFTVFTAFIWKGCHVPSDSIHKKGVQWLSNGVKNPGGGGSPSLSSLPHPLNPSLPPSISFMLKTWNPLQRCPLTILIFSSKSSRLEISLCNLEWRMSTLSESLSSLAFDSSLSLWKTSP